MLVGRDDARYRLEERLDVRREERRLVGVVEARHRRPGPVERAVAVGMDPGPGLRLGRRVGSADRRGEREALAPVRSVTGTFVGDPLGRPGQPERGRGRDDPPAHLLVQRDLREREGGVQHAGQPGCIVGVADRADRRPQPEPAKVTRRDHVERLERGRDERPGGRDPSRLRHVAGDRPAGRVERRRHDLVVGLARQHVADQPEERGRRVLAVTDHLPAAIPTGAGGAAGPPRAAAGRGVPPARPASSITLA